MESIHRIYVPFQYFIILKLQFFQNFKKLFDLNIILQFYLKLTKLQNSHLFCNLFPHKKCFYFQSNYLLSAHQSLLLNLFYYQLKFLYISVILDFLQFSIFELLLKNFIYYLYQKIQLKLSILHNILNVFIEI